jgi:hypothetical protein
MCFWIEIKKHFENSSIVSYVKSDVAFDFIHELQWVRRHGGFIKYACYGWFPVLENLISISHNLKVIIVTSSISDEDRRKSHGLSFVHGHINKP